jgi:predicted AAA+ superfamily ATPase
MYIERAVEGTIRKVSRTFPVLLVTGARQVGKTTLLLKLAEEGRAYVTLDDPETRRMAKADPALLLQRYAPPLIIDEIQYAPELLPYIKMSVDKSRANGGYWLTGSQAFHMMRDVSESLAGRVGIVRLHGLSQSEIAAIPSEPFSTDKDRLLSRLKVAPKAGLREVYGRIWRGGMPALYGDEPPEWPIFFSSYLNTYIGRDIRDLAQVADEMAFLNFMAVAAARTARPVVYEDLANESGVSAPTAKKWLSVLVSSGLAALVQPYHNNALKRVVKAPLLHFLDTGLAAYLLKWENAEVMERGAASGAFFETYAFSEIYKGFANAGLEPPLFYYRDRDQKEIDLLMLRNGTLYPVEIKKTASPGAAAVKHFSVLKPVEGLGRAGAPGQIKVGVGAGAVVCMSDDLLPLDRDNWAVPVWLL